MKEKTEKEIFVKKVFDELIKLSENDPILFSERERKILSYLPSFVKEGIEFLDPIFIVDSCFKNLENFDLEYHGKMIRCFLVEVNDRTSSDWCIKASKISHPGRTLFLGTNGINLLKKRFPEKIASNVVYSFESKHSPSSNYIHGIKLESNGHLNNKSLSHPCIIGKGNIIAIFKEIPE